VLVSSSPTSSSFDPSAPITPTSTSSSSSVYSSSPTSSTSTPAVIEDSGSVRREKVSFFV
jgi:hypothetical protein